METLKTKLQRLQLQTLPTTPADDLDARALQGDTVLCEDITYPDGYTDPVLLGGWICKYIGPRTVGETGRIILLPNTEWTRKLWRQGQIAYGVAHGLTEPQARVWMASHLPAKHDILEKLVSTLADPDLIERYMQYPLDGNHDDYLKWVSRTGIKDGLVPFRRTVLVQLLREQVEAKTKPKRRRVRDLVADAIHRTDDGDETLAAE